MKAPYRLKRIRRLRKGKTLYGDQDIEERDKMKTSKRFREETKREIQRLRATEAGSLQDVQTKMGEAQNDIIAASKKINEAMRDLGKFATQYDMKGDQNLLTAMKAMRDAGMAIIRDGNQKVNEARGALGKVQYPKGGYAADKAKPRWSG